MEGWIKLHRKFSEWEWYHESRMVHLFIQLLLIANREPGNWQGIEVKRGQVIIGRKELSEATGISEQTIRTCIKRLKSTKEITTKSTNKFTIVTICNYEDYQSTNLETNQKTNQKTNQQLTNNQPTTNHKQEVKKEKKVKENTKEKNFDCHPRIEKIFESWLEYKHERRETYKTEKSTELALKKLVKFSGNDPYTAKKIIEDAMSNNYAGFFEPKNNYQKKNQPRQGTRAEIPDYANVETIEIDMNDEDN